MTMAATTAHSIHFHGQIISRSSGRSATAAAAYRLAARIADELTGLVHDYRRKGGVVYSETLVPDHAPERYRDAATLWNAVELAEKSKNSQLAREFDIALPRELDKKQNEALAREYIEREFVSKGMCASWAYHDPDDANHNPHVHVMLTLRKVREDGAFEPKAHKEYLVRLNGTNFDMYMSARTLKEIQENRREGDAAWEKVYKYRKGNEYRELTPSEAEGWEGCKRVGKDAIDRKVDSTDWNQPERMEEWREAWSSMLNKHLALAGVDKSYDHRSFERRGIDDVPQVHIGVEAKGMEERDQASIKGEQNRVIAEINELARDERTTRGEREQLVARGYAVRQTHYDSADQVRDHAQPLIDRVREAIERAAVELRRVIARVAANPLVRSMTAFVRDLAQRAGIAVSRRGDDIRYRAGERVFRGEQIDGRFTARELDERFRESSRTGARAGAERAAERARIAARIRDELAIGQVRSLEQPGVGTSVEPELNKKGIQKLIEQKAEPTPAHYSHEEAMSKFANQPSQQPSASSRRVRRSVPDVWGHYPKDGPFLDQTKQAGVDDEFLAQIAQANIDRQAGRDERAQKRRDPLSEAREASRDQQSQQQQSRNKGKGHGHDSL